MFSISSSHGGGGAKGAGVYRDGKGGWYFKGRTSKDATTGKFSAKTLFDYRHYLVDYINPWIGDLPSSTSTRGPSSNGR